jgi:Dimethlysulfonioproprionate lyase
VNFRAPLTQMIALLVPVLPEDFANPLRSLRLVDAKAEPRPLPVCRFWNQAFRGGSPLLAPLAQLAPHLRWVQNPNYVSAPPSPRFLENYGYAVLAGPGGPVETDALAFGVLLLGPDTHYPTHRHPAAEIYAVLSGEAEWQNAAEPWRREQPGAVIRHDGLVPHATRTLAEPLLAAYLWIGDLATHARIEAPK